MVVCIWRGAAERVWVENECAAQGEEFQVMSKNLNPGLLLS